METRSGDWNHKLLVWTANKEMRAYYDDEVGEVLRLPGGVLHITDKDGGLVEGITGEVALCMGPRLQVTVENAGEKQTEEPLKSVMRFIDETVVARYSDGERWQQVPFDYGTITRITRLDD